MRWDRPCSASESLLWPETTWSRALPSTTPSSTAPMPFCYGGHDPGVVCLLLCGLGPVVSWLSGPGSEEKPRRRSPLAQELSHPFSLAHALDVCCLAPSAPPGGASSPRAGRGSDYALRPSRGFRSGWRGELFLRGWALAEQGQGEEGIAQMRQGLAATGPREQRLARPYFLALLAEAYGKVGQAEEGLLCWPRRLAMVDKTGERWYEAELYRLKGELTLAVKFKVTVQKSSKSRDSPDP